MGIICSQGLCEFKGGHLCQVQLKQLKNIQLCGDKSGHISIYNQILPASDFRLQNHSTSHLAFSPPKIYSSSSRISRVTSHVLTTAVPASSASPSSWWPFPVSFSRKTPLPLLLLLMLAVQTLLLPSPYALSFWSLGPLDYLSLAKSMKYSLGGIRFGKWNQMCE